MLGMIVEMIYGVPEMQAVMLGFGEVMFTLSKRYVSIFISFWYVKEILLETIKREQNYGTIQYPPQNGSSVGTTQNQGFVLVGV